MKKFRRIHQPADDLVDAAQHVVHFQRRTGEVGDLVQRLLQALRLLQRLDPRLRARCRQRRRRSCAAPAPARRRCGSGGRRLGQLGGDGDAGMSIVPDRFDGSGAARPCRWRCPAEPACRMRQQGRGGAAGVAEKPSPACGSRHRTTTCDPAGSCPPTHRPVAGQRRDVARLLPSRGALSRRPRAGRLAGNDRSPAHGARIARMVRRAAAPACAAGTFSGPWPIPCPPPCRVIRRKLHPACRSA